MSPTFSSVERPCLKNTENKGGRHTQIAKTWIQATCWIFNIENLESMLHSLKLRVDWSQQKDGY